MLTLPVFARALDTAEYGALELYTVGIAVAIVLVDAGMSAAAQRSFYDYRDEQLTDRRAVITDGIPHVDRGQRVRRCRDLRRARPAGELAVRGASDPSLVALAALTLPLLAVANMTREVMRLTLQPWRYVASSLIATIGGAGLAVLAVTSFDAGVKGILIATVVGTAASAVYGVAVARTYLRGRYDWHKLRTMLRYGLPLIPGLVALWATAYADRLLLANLEDLEAVGLYAIASRFAAPIVLLLTAFVTAYQPFLLALRVEDPGLESELRGRIASLDGRRPAGRRPAVGGLRAGAHLDRHAGLRRRGAGDQPPRPRHGRLRRGLGVPRAAADPPPHRRLGRPDRRHGRRPTLRSAFVLIPPFGLVGAAIASFAGYALLAVLYWWWGRRVDDAPYEPVHLVVAFALAAVAGEAWRIDLSSGALTLLLKFAVCAAFVIGLRLTHVIRPEDLGAVREIVERRLRTRGDAA